MNVVYFLLMIIPLVLFHELGHFIAARWFDVKCERFAVGMGPVVAKFTRGDTEYSFRAFPLGGYVSMLGMHFDEEIPDEDKGRALTDKPVWQRMIIYLAGPVANFLLAVPVFFLVFAPSNERAAAVIGVVTDGSAAAEAGLEVGDRVVSIDGDPIRYWDDLSDACKNAPGEALAFVVERDGEEVELTVTPEAVRVPEPLVGLRSVVVGQIGVRWPQHTSYVDVATGSQAAAAGLETFDRITRVGETPVHTWLELVAALEAGDGPRTVTALRTAPLDTDYANLDTQRVVQVQLPAGDAAALGVRRADATVFSIEPGGPAERAGLQRGDRVIAWNDRPITAIDMLVQRILGEPETAAVLVVERAGVEQTITVQPETLDVVAEFRSEREETFVGFAGLPGGQMYVAPDPVRMGTFESLWHAAVESVVKTFQYIGAIFVGVVFLVIGAVDSSNLGGPIMIADVANRAARAGILPFLELMAKISINLGIVNLLPVPGLDGGNLMLLTAEGIKREPLSNRTRQIIGYVGFVCIVLLMIFVFKNDIERYWVDVANWLNS